MSTPLVISVTDELVAELERQALERIQYQKEKQEKLNEGGRKETIVALCEILPKELLALLSERAELLRDAERYRWLRDHFHGFSHYRAMKHRPNALRDEIDAEIQKVKQ